MYSVNISNVGIDALNFAWGIYVRTNHMCLIRCLDVNWSSYDYRAREDVMTRE